MSTADWALAISILSAVISLAGFVWSVWSKFIYPKPRVRVHFSMVTAFNPHDSELGSEPVQALRLSATNFGPTDVTLLSAVVQFQPRWFSEKTHGLLNVLPEFPMSADYEAEYAGRGGPFAGGLPKTMMVGESFTVYLVPDHETLARGDYERVGFNDAFERLHWAPRRDITAALPYIREACAKSGKNWRSKKGR